MPNKKVLLISYFFPPLGMGGVGRALGLFKYLPEFGYDVIVLTVKDIVYPEYDYSLLNGLDQSKIVRTGSMDISRIFHLMGIKQSGLASSKAAGLHTYLYYPDAKRFWNLFALKAARRILIEQNIAAVITASPPPSTHLIGLALKRKYNITWVADFRDIWFSTSIEDSYPTMVQKKYATGILEKIRISADEIVTVYSNVRDRIGRGHIIMNGAELECANNWIETESAPKDKLIIGVLGTINKLSPIEPLFKSISYLIHSAPELKDKISITHVGRADHEYLFKILINNGPSSSDISIAVIVAAAARVVI